MTIGHPLDPAIGRDRGCNSNEFNNIGDEENGDCGTGISIGPRGYAFGTEIEGVEIILGGDMKLGSIGRFVPDIETFDAAISVFLGLM